MAQVVPFDRQISFVSASEAPVVAKAKTLTPEKVTPCVEVREWGKAEEMETKAWVKRIVAIVGVERAAELAQVPAPLVSSVLLGAYVGAVTGEALLGVEMPEGEPTTREQRRSRRPRDVRAKTVSVKRMTKREIELGRLTFPAEELAENDRLRPKTRGECEAARGYDENGKQNPCAFMVCKYHLAFTINEKTGSMKENFPDLEFDQLPETCALDVAARNGATLEEIGVITNTVRERVRQVTAIAMAKVRAVGDMYNLREHIEPGEKFTKRVHLRVLPGGLDEDAEDQDSDENED